MSSLTNINNNASVVNVGRTTPVSPGQQTSDKSIPVVIASDQEPIPVVEQNKVVSEVALSLLGIPRSEVALGIFADVNTYDVNPSEWSASPLEYTIDSNADGWGIKHLPDEAGALVEAPKDKSAVLTSNRFFRYQPGRVSAATFGVKSTISPSSNVAQNKIDLNPSIRKYGIFDKFDGYYWETRADGIDDNFSVVRRTQSLLRNNPVYFGTGTQFDDHSLSGKAADVYSEEPNALPTATKFLIDNRFKIIELAFADALAATGGDAAAAASLAALSAAEKLKCKRDMDLAMEAYILDLQYGGNAHTIVNGTTYRMAAVTNSAVEILVHTKLASRVASQLGTINETAAGARVYTALNTGTLSAILLATLAAPTTYPNSTVINAAVYGSRNAIATIFAIYSKFLAYMGTEYTFNDSYGIVPIASYNTSTISLSADEIKYRCYRDITYIVKGYGEDLQFGGNASTLYNAKRYFFNGTQVYSQTTATIAAEIKRHEFIKKLLTGVDPNQTQTSFLVPSNGGKTFTPVTTLFANVFNTTAVVTKLKDLCDKIITNFGTTNGYVGDIEYGRGANYGDLVVLRDGLIMTHAAVFDPTLLKQTKNVVVKPGFVVSTTNNGQVASGASTITLTSATGVTMGMTIAASVAGIASETYITAVNGSVITLSTPTTAIIANGSTISFGNSTLEVSQDEFIVGQYINFFGTSAGANSNNLTANRLYKVEKVRGAKVNIITVSDATVNSTFNASIAVTGSPVTSALLTVLDNNPNNVVLLPGVRIEGKGLPEGTYILAAGGSPGTWTITSPGNVLPTHNHSNIEVTKISLITPDVNPSNPTNLIYINPNVPFVFPKEYFVGKTTNGFTKPKGLFPLMYGIQGLPATENTISEKVGYIDTTLVNSNFALIRQQIDTVNLLYNNWVKQNVDPKYYSVYEFRIPRSRFSTDHLNGDTNDTVYSDVATNAEGDKVFPGMTVQNSEGGLIQTKSVWDIDFGKVTMLKVEFSWYGAVGALFLAYVPVGNGEARWVRVHHLRASNQLKISSLGNATLPITYLVYGGGSVSRLGIEDTVPKGYTKSNHIVKYGASYYIDGGDRGTVRLYSHSTTQAADVYGSKFSLGSLTLQPADAIGRYFDVTGVANLPSDKIFFMKSKLITGSRADQNVEIVWVDGNKLYINKGDLVSQSNLFLFVNRPSVVFGLKAKQNILNSVGTGIRNRVQVYPTKLSTSSVAPSGVVTIPRVKLQLTKTPLFQPNISTSGTFTLTSDYTIAPSKPAMVTSSAGYLPKDNDSIYGWFRANVGTVFGMLFKKGGNYYFDLLETYSEEVTLRSGNAAFKFLADGRYSFNGDSLTGTTEDTLQKERLSSVFISTQTQAPIPKTGTEVASFFLENGSDLFDLLNYFDYNKDYLSFPLTDKVESVYLLASSTQASTGTAPTNSVAEVNSSLTWEEQ